MGRIHEGVERLLAKDALQFSLLKPFLSDFDVTYGAATNVFGSDVHFYFLNPERTTRDQFGFEREVLLLYSKYPSVEARNLQAAGSLMTRVPALGRVDPLMYFFVSPAQRLVEDVARLMAETAQARIPIPIRLQELLAVPDSGFIHERMRQHLFHRDLFDVSHPIVDDQFFFGRTSLVLELRESILRGENTGLFGLRKMGKTSLLLKLKRLMHEEKSGALAYLDLQDAHLYEMRWWDLLDEIRRVMTGDEKRSRSSKEAAKLFRRAVEALGSSGPQKRVVVALDEIEHISPKLGMRPHWSEQADFLELWKTIRAVQNVNRHLSFIVAGVNATVIETPVFAGHDNPLFSMARVKYVPAFNAEEVGQMVGTLGRYMGLKFDSDACRDLRAQYGGHPLLTRQACSYVHRALAASDTHRPVSVTAATLSTSQGARDAALFPWADHILGMLKQYYLTEYQLLEHLAAGDDKYFEEMATAVPQFVEHLRAYQLIDGTPPVLAIPFLARYMRAQAAQARVAVPSSRITAPAEQGADVSGLLEISKLRNTLEPLLRRYIKRTLKAHRGADRWIDTVLDAVPTEQRKPLQGVAADEILERKLFLQNLLSVIVGNWEMFKHLEAGPPEKRVTRDQFKVLGDYVNAHREDAHAKPVSEAELAALRIVVPALVSAVTRYLDD